METTKLPREDRKTEGDTLTREAHDTELRAVEAENTGNHAQAAHLHADAAVLYSDAARIHAEVVEHLTRSLVDGT